MNLRSKENVGFVAPAMICIRHWEGKESFENRSQCELLLAKVLLHHLPLFFLSGGRGHKITQGRLSIKYYYCDVTSFSSTVLFNCMHAQMSLMWCVFLTTIMFDTCNKYHNDEFRALALDSDIQKNQTGNPERRGKDFFTNYITNISVLTLFVFPIMHKVDIPSLNDTA